MDAGGITELITGKALESHLLAIKVAKPWAFIFEALLLMQI